jgi:hypothetical protein
MRDVDQLSIFPIEVPPLRKALQEAHRLAIIKLLDREQEPGS